MSRSSRWLMIGVVLAGLAGIAWRLWPNDERKIRQTILGMAADATFTGHEGNFAKLGKIGSIAGRFAEDAEVHLEQVLPLDGPLKGRETIRQMLTAGAPYMGAVTVQVYDLQVQLVDDVSATALLTASAKTTGKKGEFDAQEFELRMVKREGRWLVGRVEAVLGYRKPNIQ